jgi:amino-acid N-acetyltransferase
VTGNFVVARPIGVLDGVDHLFTGQVRRVHSQRIRTLLDARALVMLSPVGYSPSGQAFNLASDELAADVALALKRRQADHVRRRRLRARRAGPQPHRSGAGRARRAARPHHPEPYVANQLRAMLRACRGGVPRCHLVSYEEDGALLQELFTARGHGTELSEQRADLVRPARLDDVAGIVEVIRPLEERGRAGAPRPRPAGAGGRQLLRRRARRHRGRLLRAVPGGDGCAELACVAVHDAYRGSGVKPGIGERLLAAAEAAAAAAGIQRLFVLTTQTRDWFVEHGFEDADIGALPAPKQALYNYQRNSKVMFKNVEP